MIVDKVYNISKVVCENTVEEPAVKIANVDTCDVDIARLVDREVQFRNSVADVGGEEDVLVEFVSRAVELVNVEAKLVEVEVELVDV